EANLPACEEAGIPVLRRCSGGGTVIQGPGCLSYAVILRFDEAGPLASVSGANQFIMERQREALENLLGKPVSISGHTDLAVGEMKFSGNAQRRKRSALLFHGTFLLNFDLPLINRCLRFPSIVPDYRSKRSHLDFVTNLKISTSSLKSALCKFWKIAGALENPPSEETRQLCEERYSRSEWHAKRP
ncbi:MAG TPA: hypothetical protein VK968_06255, partial [Roseimicrobium sp.]|nr:hypothetical protein [Roseimicrobium sp.]